MLPIWLCVNFHSSCCWYEYIVGSASQWHYLLTIPCTTSFWHWMGHHSQTTPLRGYDLKLFCLWPESTQIQPFRSLPHTSQPSPAPTQLNSHSMTCQFRKENFSNRMRIIYALAISLPIHPLNFKFICQLLIGFRLLPFSTLCVSARSVAEREEC